METVGCSGFAGLNSFTKTVRFLYYKASIWMEAVGCSGFAGLFSSTNCTIILLQGSICYHVGALGGGDVVKLCIPYAILWVGDNHACNGPTVIVIYIFTYTYKHATANLLASCTG